MKVAVVGLGLIGGSFEKASRRAGHEVATLHHGDATGFETADLILLCLPPEAIVPWMIRHQATIRPGAFVIDIAGIKRDIMRDYAAAFPGKPAWTFVGGHPMAGREVSGYANSLATLFDGASMILVPQEGGGEVMRRETGDMKGLDSYFRSVGFARVVVTTAEKHDEMIAFTSQLCHVIATAYSRDALVPETPGFSAGSYADMTRIATQDPAIWASLFLANRDSLGNVVDRFVARMTVFRNALANGDRAKIETIISEGAEAKRREKSKAKVEVEGNVK